MTDIVRDLETLIMTAGNRNMDDVEPATASVAVGLPCFRDGWDEVELKDTLLLRFCRQCDVE